MVIRQAIRMWWHLKGQDRNIHNTKKFMKHAKKFWEAWLDLECEVMGESRYDEGKLK